jgi:thiamine-phosphate diphosphorylase/hydroxyethylthiazole kinase
MLIHFSKEDTKSIIGTSGVQEILRGISNLRLAPTVAIGGINANNVQRVLYQSSAKKRDLYGVAIVSAIMAAKDPSFAARQLLELIKGPSPFYVTIPGSQRIEDVTALVNSVPNIVKKVGQQNPLSHNMTNLVVQNIAANVALCM